LKRGESIEGNLEIARETAAAFGEVDTVFECTDVPSYVQTAIYAIRPGGKVMLIGMGTQSRCYRCQRLLFGRLIFSVSFDMPIHIQLRLRLLSNPNTPDFSKLISHRCKGFNEISQAFDTAGKAQDSTGKLVLKS